MSSEEQIHDSPESWVNKHIQSYVKSNGDKGHQWRGLPTLLITTRGRKSGLLRRTALIYGQDGEHYVVVASNGGSTSHPAWYLNLTDNATVEVQVGAERFTAEAHTATSEEKVKLWPLMASIFPTYNRYQATTNREIPVVVLVPVPVR